MTHRHNVVDARLALLDALPLLFFHVFDCLPVDKFRPNDHSGGDDDDDGKNKKARAQMMGTYTDCGNQRCTRTADGDINITW